MAKNLKNLIFKKLAKVLDPELQIPITDLGLIYDILEEKAGKIKIKMTLTTISCPLFSLLEEEIRRKLLEIDEIKEVKVELTFDPPWTPEKFSEEAKIKLGFFK